MGNTWVITLLCGGRNAAATAPDDIDHFFVVDEDPVRYLIPVAAVGARQAIHRSGYGEYRLSLESFTGVSSR